MKEVADDNFKRDENERKISKRVENTVGKGEIARDEQFLLYMQCFQKTCNADQGLFGKGLRYTKSLRKRKEYTWEGWRNTDPVASEFRSIWKQHTLWLAEP